MTPNEAKRITASKLAELGLTHKLTARTIGFQDLARDDRVFVKIHDWQPSPLADEITAVAREHGFSIDW